MREELPATLVVSSERHNAKYRWWKIVSRAAKPAVSRAKPVAGLGRAAKTTKLSLLSLTRRRRHIKKTGRVEDQVDEGINQMARVSGPSCALAAGALWRIGHNIEGNMRINFLITQRMNKSVEESNLVITVLTVSTCYHIVYNQVWRSW